MIACQGDDYDENPERVFPDPCPYIYEGSNVDNESAWILRVALKEDSSLVYDKEEMQSVILMGEHVFGMVEYAANKLLITTYPNIAMIVSDWKAVHMIVHEGAI